MRFNTMKIVGITVVALASVASSGASFAGNSPFCFGGGPTPKYVCDAIKANQKPRAVVGNKNLTYGSSDVGARSTSGRVVGR